MNTKFLYYITDTINGVIIGSNDIQIALDFSTSEDYFVLDARTGDWITTTGRVAIEDYNTTN